MADSDSTTGLPLFDAAIPRRDCLGCRERKPMTDFYSSQTKKHGRYKTVYTPRCRDCIRRDIAQRKIDDPEANAIRQRACNLKRKRKNGKGMSIACYDAMLAEQDGVCAICRRPEEIRRGSNGLLIPLCVDHDHETGEVRGLLCNNCNLMVGYAKDRPDLLRIGADYLDRHNSQCRMRA